MSKVTVIGAGNVGATCANVLAARKVAGEVVLIDIKEGLSEGKMLDIYQTSTLLQFDTKVTGVTNDYAATANSDVVVITSGVPRKPGMTREELIGVNAGIVKSVMGEAMKHSPNAVYVIVANPMDTMTYLALKSSGLPAKKVFGMGGQLDSSRFRCYLAKALGASMNDVDGMVIGGHGDTTMLPLIDKASWRGVPVWLLIIGGIFAFPFLAAVFGCAIGALLIAGIAVVVAGFIAMTHNPAMGFLLLGLGLVLSGFGILLLIAGINLFKKVVPTLFRWIADLGKKLFKKRGAAL